MVDSCGRLVMMDSYFTDFDANFDHDDDVEDDLYDFGDPEVWDWYCRTFPNFVNDPVTDALVRR